MILADIREAIAERLATVPGVRAIAYPPDQIPTGTGVVVIVQQDGTYVDYHESFARGLAIVNVTLTPWVQMTSERAAFGRLDALLSSSSSNAEQSLIDALMGTDRTLGGVCADIIVDTASNVRAESIADGTRYLCADLSMRVMVGRN